eukprot:3728176-Rhodomonas_salina.3
MWVAGATIGLGIEVMLSVCVLPYARSVPDSASGREQHTLGQYRTSRDSSWEAPRHEIRDNTLPGAKCTESVHVLPFDFARGEGATLLQY